MTGYSLGISFPCVPSPAVFIKLGTRNVFFPSPPNLLPENTKINGILNCHKDIRYLNETLEPWSKHETATISS